MVRLGSALVTRGAGDKRTQEVSGQTVKVLGKQARSSGTTREDVKSV